MTRSSKPKSASAKPRKSPARRAARSDYWLLQDAKARFSELVRKVRSNDEVALAHVADAWSRSYRSKEVTFAASNSAVETARLLHVLHRVDNS